MIDCLSLILEIGTLVSPLSPCSLMIPESDQNLGIKNMEFGIFEHNLQFDIIILTLLPSKLQLEYAFYPWF